MIVRVDDGHGRPIEISEQAVWTQKDHRLRADDEVREASNTKTMMATLVLQLVAEHRLALTDSVEKWLPGQVRNGQAITLRMLLNHTSGLFDYTDDPALAPALTGRDPHVWTSAEILRLVSGHPALFEPGSEWSYSNTNYIAIGAVLEKATGKSLATLVRDRISAPLGLRHTFYATGSAWRERHAHGYEPDAAHMPSDVPEEFRTYAGPQHDDHVDVTGDYVTADGADAAIVSTAGDWSRFYGALMSGRLLPAAQLAQMRTTVPEDGPGTRRNSATGWASRRRRPTAARSGTTSASSRAMRPTTSPTPRAAARPPSSLPRPRSPRRGTRPARPSWTRSTAPFSTEPLHAVSGAGAGSSGPALPGVARSAKAPSNSRARPGVAPRLEPEVGCWTDATP